MSEFVASNVAKMCDTPLVEKTLRTKEGTFMHAFRSGGGLRVLRLECKKKGLLAYGEHPTADIALVYLEEDHKAGGRKYEKVYGPIYPHYLTGTSDPSNELDRWLLRGRGFDIKYEDGQFAFTSKFMPRWTCPQKVQDMVWGKGRFTPVRYRQGGGEYEGSKSESHFGFVSVKTITPIPGLDKYGDKECKVTAVSLGELWEKLETELPILDNPNDACEVLYVDGEWHNILELDPDMN